MTVPRASRASAHSAPRWLHVCALASLIVAGPAGCGFSDALLGLVVDDTEDGGTSDAGHDADTETDQGSDASDDAGSLTLTLRVTNTLDAGPGSLRQALLDAASASSSTISFDIPEDDPGRLYYRDNGATGLSAPVSVNGSEASIADFDADYPAGTARSWWRITLLSPLPAVSDVGLDGASQKAARGITANGPVIELVGDALPAAPGLDLTRSSVKGLILGGFDGPGLLMAGMGSTIVSVYSGVDPAGIIAHPNLVGAELVDATSGGVGGSAADELCVFAGNTDRHLVLRGAGTSGVQVSQTFCGSDPTGQRVPLGASAASVGIDVDDGVSGLRLGGPSNVNRVLASGNELGVRLRSASNVSLEFVYVGATPPPAFPAHTPLPNAQEGVRMELVDGVDVRNCMINWNGGAGVFIASGDGVVLRNNVILENGGLAIDLAPLGPNPASGTEGSGPNQGQNAPVILGQLSGPTRLSLTLTSEPDATFVIDLEYEAAPGTAGEPILARTQSTVQTSAAGFVAFEMATTLTPEPDATFVVAATLMGPSGPVRTSERATLAFTP
ncbi:MAG: right-handed parallel beta-helix repeat-containing protein [Polyangiales bacterium]